MTAADAKPPNSNVALKHLSYIAEFWPSLADEPHSIAPASHDTAKRRAKWPAQGGYERPISKGYSSKLSANRILLFCRRKRQGAGILNLPFCVNAKVTLRARGEAGRLRAFRACNRAQSLYVRPFPAPGPKRPCKESRKPEGPRDGRGSASDRHEVKGSAHAALRACFSRASGSEPGSGRCAGGTAPPKSSKQATARSSRPKPGASRASPTRSTATARRISCCSTSKRPARVVAELERQTRINEDVIRYLTVRVDEHEEGPSVMMRKQDRERTRRRETGGVD